ncbi:hypothetical protein JW933_00345, partial [candidate division FCPU426 bacterium]|nr:hypothetical protein [candidate division FCPU426 bacterium]
VLGWERSWNFLALARMEGEKIEERYAYGAAWAGFSSGGDIEARTANRPEPEYVFRDSQNAFILSGASSLGKNMAVGVNCKYLSHALDTGFGSGMGVDLGFWHHPFLHTAWGLMLQDIYSQLGWGDEHTDRLPLYLRAGAAQQMLDEALLLSGDLGLECFQAAGAVRDIRYHLGAEYRIAGQWSVRAGLDSGRWTLGVGGRLLLGNFAWLQIDYAAAGERLPAEGITHFISLAAHFLP